MPVANVFLYSSSNANADPATLTPRDVTAQAVAGTPILFDAGKAYRETFFFAKMVDDAGLSNVASLGGLRTTDTEPPVVTASVVAAPRGSSDLTLTYSISDNSSMIGEVVVSATLTDPRTDAAGAAAAIRAAGVTKAPTVVTNAQHTFTGLAYVSPYFVSVLAVDAAGNATVVVRTAVTSSDDTSPPTVTVGIARGSRAATSLVLTYSVTDNKADPVNLWASATVVDPSTQADPEGFVFQYGVALGTALTGTHTFSGLAPATSYFVSVLAVDAAGNRVRVADTLATLSDTPPVLQSFALRAPTPAEGDAQRYVVIELLVTDPVS